ncbi:hypothetical protein M752DRAFT_163681 [Aspergillus phoenicis ATCC 13157]|uniref:Uncharacterized protein n=1 Tax=Aspergillus phoenicis ATCC 13157 TaxID=1353007 RepID=A0A370PL43_ASPPH|nr:hypothetical protein M752DRAFT_163681 [Aspergillus phoenicis ATCC 13157]
MDFFLAFISASPGVAGRPLPLNTRLVHWLATDPCARSLCLVMVISPDSGVSWMTRAQARAFNQPTMKQRVGVQTSDKFYTLGWFRATREAHACRSGASRPTDFPFEKVWR